MQLKTSWFNPTLYRKNLTRFWPIWGAYGLIWLLALPGMIFASWIRGEMEDSFVPDNINSLVMTEGGQLGLFLAFFFSCAAALAVFSYLYQHRSSVAMHAFPLRRECLFLTNYLSGLSFFVLPLAVVFVLTLGAEALCGYVNVSGLLVWFTAQIGYVLFFYSFGVFCGMFTGNAFAMPLFYGILSILAPVMTLLTEEMLRMFVYGYSSSNLLDWMGEYLSPILTMLRRVQMSTREEGGDFFYYMTGWNYIIIYALVGVALAVVALLVYRKRRVETAGDVVAVPAVRPLFKYGVGVCAALTFGSMLFLLFGQRYSEGSVWVMLMFLLLGGALGYFVAQMLLSKSFRVFRRHWKGYVAMSAALAVVTSGIYFDVFGMINRVPAAGQVEEVRILRAYTQPDGRQDFVFTDPEEIQAVLALNQTIADRHVEIQNQVSRVRDGSAGDSDTFYFDIYYYLNDDSTLSRSYEIVVSEEELADENSPAAQLLSILRGADVNWFDGNTAQAVVGCDVMDYTKDFGVNLDQAQARVLFEAVQEDLAADRIGVQWLIQDEEYRARNTRVVLEFSMAIQTEEGDSYLRTYSIVVQTASSSTLAALEELGVLDQMTVENYNGEIIAG